jgi:hypothetical protein
MNKKDDYFQFKPGHEVPLIQMNQGRSGDGGGHRGGDLRAGNASAAPFSPAKPSPSPLTALTLNNESGTITCWMPRGFKADGVACTAARAQAEDRPVVLH